VNAILILPANGSVLLSVGARERQENESEILMLLVVKQPAVLAIGTDGHHYTHLKGKQQAGIKCHQSCMQKLTFLGKFWSKNNQSFCTIRNLSTSD
jgi:histidinol phosphatase-like PHP family hydrolase